MQADEGRNFSLLQKSMNNQKVVGGKEPEEEKNEEQEATLSKRKTFTDYLPNIFGRKQEDQKPEGAKKIDTSSNQPK